MRVAAGTAKRGWVKKETGMGWKKGPAQLLPLLGILLAKPKLHSLVGLYVCGQCLSLALNLLIPQGFCCFCPRGGSGCVGKYRRFRFLKHQEKVIIICLLEVPPGARCDADSCDLQRLRTQSCVEVLAIQIPQLGGQSSVLSKTKDFKIIMFWKKIKAFRKCAEKRVSTFTFKNE